MGDFSELYESTCTKLEDIEEGALRPLLEEVYESAIEIPAQLERLKRAFIALTTFLCSSQGRTAAHCWAVDHFFSDYDDHWLPLTAHLPEEYQDILGHFQFLHGAVDEPEYHTAPEQLLEMAEKLAS